MRLRAYLCMILNYCHAIIRLKPGVPCVNSMGTAASIHEPVSSTVRARGEANHAVGGGRGQPQEILHGFARASSAPDFTSPQFGFEELQHVGIAVQHATVAAFLPQDLSQPQNGQNTLHRAWQLQKQQQNQMHPVRRHVLQRIAVYWQCVAMCVAMYPNELQLKCRL